MKSTQFVLRTVALSLLFAGALAQAATVTGTVTNKTTGKPAVGDPVVLVDLQAGMGEAAHATTDARGHYSLKQPGNGSYLVRVTHQGAGYFIGAPQGGAPGDIAVYNVAAKVKGVFIEADVIEVEADSGQLKVNERFFVHNTSSPPMTQWSPHSFEIVLPAEAVIGDVGAQRPSGLPTNIKLDPNGAKGHYSFNLPIQPDMGDKDTLFQVGYTLPYASGKYTFKTQVTLPADNVGVLLPKTMTLASGSETDFKQVQGDAGLQTFLVKNALPGKVIEFTVSGIGAIPSGQQDGGQDASASGSQPGGGMSTPINTPDPLSKYKWWLLGGMALLLAAAAAFLLRKPTGTTAPGAVTGAATYTAPASVPAKQDELLNALKDELFALESDKLAGTITPEKYAEEKTALEIVLKRALDRKQ
jgi:hypothetical protein